MNLYIFGEIRCAYGVSRVDIYFVQIYCCQHLLCVSTVSI
jgi:hypothetical protein